MLKIMVVDDEIDICDFVKNFFKERNFEVFTAHNGEEALNLIEAESPDIVLLDVSMPVMNGLDTLKEIKRSQKTCKVVMVTAVEDAESMEKAKSYGAVDYITKPLSLEELEQTVLSVAEQINKVC